MRKKKKWLVGMLVIVNVFLLFGCGKRQETRDDKVHIGVTYYNQSDTFLNELLARFKEQLKNPEHEELEATVTILDAAGSQRTQDDQVKELIDMGCDVLCVNLVDRADPSEIIDLARDHDVPIIFFNREPVEEDLRQWDELYYVGAEAKQSGVMQGELAAEVIQKNTQIDKNRDGKIQYVVLEGEAGHQDSIIRTGNAVDTIKNSGIELEKQNAGMVNIEITNKNIKSFERYARKYGINYALKKDKSKEPPVYLVFFKGRDQDALNAAFREFSQKQIQKANKPSIHKRLAAYRAMMPKKTKDKVKNRHQEQSR